MRAAHGRHRRVVRVISAESLTRHVAALPHSNPRVVMSGNHAVPWTALDAVDRAREEYRLFVLNAPPGVPDRAGVTLETPFVGPGMRRSRRLSYYPSRLSLVPSLLQQVAPPDVVIVHAAPPRGELLSLGIEVNVMPAAVEAARARGALVIAQINPQMPYTYGDALLHVSDVDLAVECDSPLDELLPADLSDVHRAIAANVADLIVDGATLQLGIGAVPDAALGLLRSRRSLRIWSEMISDGVLGLEKAGALAEASLTTSFAAGSAEFYDWLDDNPRITFCRTERANDPAVIARQSTMTSINAAMQVDLFAQANASYSRGRIHSGFGGQTDFVVGALHSAGGKAIIALASWHRPTASSTIVGRLQQPATSFQHSFVVTEHGVATIWGKPQREQAEQLITRAADPRAREELTAIAAELF